MNSADLNWRFTATVYDYISRGYTINLPTMRSISSDECGKVDMTDGKEIIRILLEEFLDDTDAYRLRGVRLIIGRATEKYLTPHKRSYDCIWNDNLDVLSEERFYRIGEWNNDWYGTKPEAIAREKLHRERMHNRWESECVMFGESAKRIVLPFLRRQKNRKSAAIKDITRVYKRIYGYGSEQSVKYIVSSKGRDFVLNGKE